MNLLNRGRYAKEEKVRRLILNRCKVDPLFWLEHRFKESPKAFKWTLHEGYENHIWDGTKDPIFHTWQGVANVYQSILNGEIPKNRFFGVESATGTGKTYFLVRLALWFLDSYPNSLVVTSAPKHDQLKLNLWSEISRIMPKFRKLHPNSKRFKSLRLVVDNSKVKKKKGNEDDWQDSEDESIDTSDSWHCAGYVSGTDSEEDSSNKVRGFHRQNMLIILEETTGMSPAVLTAFQNTCTGQHNIIVAVGNPDSQHDPLHQFCRQPNVQSVRISALDYPNIVLQKELYAGAITQVSVSERAASYGINSGIFNRMVRGISPTQTTDALIKSDWIDNAFERGKLYVHDNDIAQSAIGIDPSNSHAGDKSAVAIISDYTLCYLKEFQCPNANHLAYNLMYDSATLLNKGYLDYDLPKTTDYNANSDYIGVDGVGIGVATVNTFLECGYDVCSLQGGQWSEAIPKQKDGKPMYFFANLRAQMMWQLREDLRCERLNFGYFDTNTMLSIKRELSAIKFAVSENTIAIEKKEDLRKRLGKSPNVLDAIAYANWMRQGHRTTVFAMPLLGGL